MRCNPYTIGPEEETELAATIMVNERIGALPVVHKKELVGIITSTHVLQAYVNLCKVIGSVADELL